MLQMGSSKLTGKTEENSCNSIGLCSKVVLEPMSDLENSGLRLYTDNYYTSPILYNHGINACGTARPNACGFPKGIDYKGYEA